MLQTSKDGTHLNTAHYRADVARNPPFVTFPINETIGMKSPFVTFSMKKRCHIPCFVTKMRYLCKQTVSIRTVGKLGNQEIRLHHYYEMAVAAPMR